MERQGYQVELAWGIAFTDAQHVRFKGSQVGYALLDIEKKLKQEQILKQRQEYQQSQGLVREKEKTLKQSRGVKI